MKHINALTIISLILVISLTILTLYTSDVIYRHLFSSVLFIALIILIKVNSTQNSTNK